VMDEEDVPSTIRSRLANGDRVELFGKSGEPRWHNVVFGNESVHQKTEDGSWTIECQKLGLIELLPDPGVERFRFSVLVRHVGGVTKGNVGVYFGHRILATPSGQAHYFGQWGLTERPDHPLANESKILLGAMLRGARFKAPTITMLGGEVLPLPNDGLVDAPPRETWRRLVVDCTPVGAVLHWAGDELITIPRPLSDVQQTDLRNLTQLDAKTVMDFPPRAGVGLFVLSGAGAFRQAVIEPLP